MVNSIREKKAFPIANIAILTMYNCQKIVTTSMFIQLAKKLGLPRSAFPVVETVDSFQSRENTMVIVDTTVTDQLGFFDHENRLTMACTRAKDVFMLVGSVVTMAKSLSGGDETGKRTLKQDRYTKRNRKVNDKKGIRRVPLCISTRKMNVEVDSPRYLLTESVKS